MERCGKESLQMRTKLVLLGALTMGVLLLWNLHAATQQITVYKTPTCGCCGVWVNHLKEAGFQVVVKEVPSTAEYQTRYGVPEKLRSCHTATVEEYFIEGHVPASEIQRLLKERPKAKGLTVPGMPIGSPGMEVGDRRDKYSVILLQADGKASVYREYPAR
jgi:hypothetical protein